MNININIKKATKEVTIDKVLPNKIVLKEPNEIVKFDKILPKKIVNKIITTSKDDWKNYYKNLNPSINSIIHNLTKNNIHCTVKGIR